MGSVRQLVDPTGQLLLAQSFDPFGNVLEQGGAGQSIFGYTGEQTDSTDLIYLRARYYQPEVGRFLTPDTIVPEPLSSRGWNGYAYTGNNPVRFVDPSGRCRGLSGVAFDICAGTVLGLAEGVHQANKYRNDIFFPDANTTFQERWEASVMVGGGSLVLANLGLAVSPAATTYAAVGGVSGGSGNAIGQWINGVVGGKSPKESLYSIDTTDVGLATFVGTVGGWFTPATCTTTGGNIAMGASSNGTLYTLSQWTHGEQISYEHLTGQIVLGGTVSWILGPVDTNIQGPFLNPQTEMQIKMMEDLLSRGSAFYSISGATATNVDWPSLFGSKDK